MAQKPMLRTEGEELTLTGSIGLISAIATSLYVLHCKVNALHVREISKAIIDSVE